MASLANDSCSSDISEKRASEIVFAPRYKPRKVNAKREFPPGCGNSVMKDFKPVEDGSSGGDGTLHASGVKNVKFVADDLRLSGAAYRMESAPPGNPSDGVTKIGVINPFISQKETSNQQDVVGFQDSAVVVERPSDKAAAQNKATFPTAVECATASVIDGSLGDCSELDAKYGLNKVDGVKNRKIDFSVDEEAIAGNSSIDFSMLKSKYSSRKVSAIREFPPHCGGDSLVPVQVKLTETSVSDFRNAVESGGTSSAECKTDPQTSGLKTEQKRDVCNSGTMHEEGFAAGSEATERSKGKEIVVFPMEKINSTDDSVLKIGSKREDVQVLMAESYCPWRKRKVNVINSDGGASGINHQQNVSQRHKSITSPSCDVTMNTAVLPEDPDAHRFRSSLDVTGNEDHGACNEGALDILPVSAYMSVVEKNDYHCSPGESDEVRSDELGREIVQCLMAAPHCPWRKRKKKHDKCKSTEKKLKHKLFSGMKLKPVAKKSVPKSETSGLKKKKQVRTFNDDGASSGALVLTNDPSLGYDKQSPSKSKQGSFEVSLPPFGESASGCNDARNNVRYTLRLFSAICRKLMHEEEAHSLLDNERKPGLKKKRRIDLEATTMIKEKGKGVNTDKVYLGEVPGVEVGDEFQYRVELAIVGIHRLFQSGIDSIKLNGVPVAVSVVASGAYADDVENADVLIYSGQGGNVVGKAKMRPEDQKLEKGNLALRNSISTQTPVRVIRGWKETRVDPLDPKPKVVTTYVYDGLYTVKNYWTETGPHGKQVFMFEMRRNPGQPELAWKQLRKSGKSKIQPGVCVEDISQGQEPFPISAVNTLTDEKPAPFNYVPKIKYPEWFHPIPLPGCDCTGRCSDSKKCRCAVMNDGNIPYNRNGALVETKPLVYECGPLCGCPPSCYNRVTQRGIKCQLEIFKTESRGWGVRALSSIPSGSFICEYAGELLEDREAEERVGNDEYLFDIGSNSADSPPPSHHGGEAFDSKTDGGFTIDAAEYGNVGRFINHSCLPNLYAQNVLYDHDDTRMPHIMLFALENIPPLQELTYSYNYSMGQIADSEGNIKMKKCFCGAAQCTGRLY